MGRHDTRGVPDHAPDPQGDLACVPVCRDQVSLEKRLKGRKDCCKNATLGKEMLLDTTNMLQIALGGVMYRHSQKLSHETGVKIMQKLIMLSMALVLAGAGAHAMEGGGRRLHG